jgi:hypothetical protein
MGVFSDAMVRPEPCLKAFGVSIRNNKDDVLGKVGTSCRNKKNNQTVRPLIYQPLKGARIDNETLTYV